MATTENILTLKDTVMARITAIKAERAILDEKRTALDVEENRLADSIISAANEVRVSIQNIPTKMICPSGLNNTAGYKRVKADKAEMKARKGKIIELVLANNGKFILADIVRRITEFEGNSACTGWIYGPAMKTFLSNSYIVINNEGYLQYEGPTEDLEVNTKTLKLTETKKDDICLK